MDKKYTKPVGNIGPPSLVLSQSLQQIENGKFGSCFPV